MQPRQNIDVHNLPSLLHLTRLHCIDHAASDDDRVALQSMRFASPHSAGATCMTVGQLSTVQGNGNGSMPAKLADAADDQVCFCVQPLQTLLCQSLSTAQSISSLVCASTGSYGTSTSVNHEVVRVTPLLLPLKAMHAFASHTAQQHCFHSGRQRHRILSNRIQWYASHA